MSDYPKCKHGIGDPNNLIECKECVIEELREIIQQLEIENKRLITNLENIIEYWNRDENPGAMSDALWHIIETAEQTLNEIQGDKK